MFRFAINEEWMEFNPADNVRPPAKENRRERFLSEDEIHDVWHASKREEAAASSILRLQMLTGQRISEVRTIQCEDIDVATGWWTIPAENSKNRRPHRVPLSSQALLIVKNLVTARKSGYLFPWRRDASKPLPEHVIRNAVTAIKGLTGVDFRTHDLRRTVATSLAAAGVPTNVVGRILNHTERGATARHYNWHSYDQEKKATLDRWGRIVEQIVTRTPKESKVLVFVNEQ
jgi:integrase